MKIENVENLLLKLIKDNKNFHCILINGRWGCGKTTIINNSIRRLRRKFKRVYYQSLYGIKNISEIGICFESNKIIRHTVHGVSSLTKYIPLVGRAINDHLDYALNSTGEKIKIRKKSLFIFDDVERTDPDFSYTALLGLFNQLVLKKCQIVCASSMYDLSNMAEGKVDDLQFFIEKTFDRIININETPYEIIRSIYKKYALDISDEAIDLFDQNIRLAKRTCVLVRTILDNQNRYNYDIESEFTISQIIECGISVIKGIYVNIIEKEANKDDEYVFTDGLDKNTYKRIIKTLNSVAPFSSEDKIGMESLAKGMAIYETFEDFSLLIKYFPSNTNVVKEDFLHSESFYLLNDEDKEKYITEFIKATKNNTIQFDRWYGDRLIELIQFGDLKSHEDFIDFLFEKFTELQCEAFNRIKEHLDFNEIQYGAEIIQQFIEKVLTGRNNNEAKKVIGKINETIKNKDYSYLNSIISESNHYKLVNKKFLLESLSKNLRENGFYLPEFNESISMQCWRSCHNIAEFCSKNDMTNEFIECLKAQYKKYNNKKSAISKIKSLVVYRFGKDIFDSNFSNFN
jgi:hypothetical protein